MRSRELNAYIKERMVAIEGETNFFRVVKPLFVFKQVTTRTRRRAICNLIIPIGASVHIPANDWTQTEGKANFLTKMRASTAYVHSMCTIHRYLDASWKAGVSMKFGYSMYNRNFVYKKGGDVFPGSPFSWAPHDCRSGIHFFVSLDKALSYQL